MDTVTSHLCVQRLMLSWESMISRLATLDDTLEWGSLVAQQLKPGSVVALVGTLGAGKTHATKGIVAGLGCEADVSSPTFTLVHEYEGGRLPVFHFDFYRLESGDEVIGLGWDDYLEAGGVMIIEWADLFPDLLPEGSRWFRFDIQPDGVREVAEGPAPC